MNLYIVASLGKRDSVIENERMMMAYSLCVLFHLTVYDWKLEFVQHTALSIYLSTLLQLLPSSGITSDRIIHVVRLQVAIHLNSIEHGPYYQPFHVEIRR